MIEKNETKKWFKVKFYIAQNAIIYFDMRDIKQDAVDIYLTGSRFITLTTEEFWQLEKQLNLPWITILEPEKQSL